MVAPLPLQTHTNLYSLRVPMPQGHTHPMLNVQALVYILVGKHHFPLFYHHLPFACREQHTLRGRRWGR